MMRAHSKPQCFVTMPLFAAALLICLMFSFPSSSSQSAPVVVTGDAGVDEDSDNVFEGLKVDVELSVPSGNYTFAAELHSVATPSLTFFITKVSERHIFFDGPENGADAHSIVFNGTLIYNSGRDGPYLVKIVVMSEDSEAEYESSYTTREYSHSSFSSTQGSALLPEHVPEATFGDESIIIRNKVFVVQLNRTSPEIIYYYATDNGTTGKYVMRYVRLIAFKDSNGDMAYNDGESVANSDFGLHKWSIGNINIARDLSRGDYIEFDMAAQLDILDKTFVHVCEASITFHYFIATGNTSVPYGAYSIAGGVEMKIDILMSFPEPAKLSFIGADHVALEQKLFDEKAAHDYRLVEGSGAHTFDDKKAEPLRKFVPTGERSEVCRLINSSGVEHGFYSWASNAEVEGVSGSANVTAAISVDRSLRLFLCYPFTSNTTSILHDPSVGVIEANKPYEAIVTNVKSTAEKFAHDPAIYSISACVAALTVFATMWARKKRR